MTALTYREAATRVNRSPNSIKRWRRHGMPMTWDVRDGQRVRVVDEGVLLGWFRGRLAADPVHQLRLGKQRDAIDDDSSQSSARDQPREGIPSMLRIISKIVPTPHGPTNGIRGAITTATSSAGVWTLLASVTDWLN